MEFILSVSVQYSTFSQHEQLHAGTLGVLAKQRVMSNLHNNKVTKSHILPRINKYSCLMAPVGKNAKHRATLEVEWWFCRNEGLSRFFSVTHVSFFVNISLFVLKFCVAR